MADGPVWNDKAPGQYYTEFWAPLKQHLNENLQNDINRIYTESLYCDWIIELDDTTIQLNKCILKTRAYRFYKLLINLEGQKLNKLQIDCIFRFLQKIYYENNIETEETAVLCEIESLSYVGTPDSDDFITADNSPSDSNKNDFFDAENSLKDDSNLDLELKEQDHLSDLFQSLQFQSTKKRNVKTFHPKIKKPPLLIKHSKIATLSDMDSGLETASSETSGMDLSDPLHFNLDQLSNKESRLVHEHDSSSSDTTDDFEDLGKNVKNELVISQTKEQKQKQNEEIVIMESSSVSSETGSWESVFPRASTLKEASPAHESTQNTSNGHSNHFFIDASSLLDENEMSAPVPSSDLLKSAAKVTKVTKNEVMDNQKFEVAEFQKEIKVFEPITSMALAGKVDLIGAESASTSSASPELSNQHEFEPVGKVNFLAGWIPTETVCLPTGSTSTSSASSEYIQDYFKPVGKVDSAPTSLANLVRLENELVFKPLDPVGTVDSCLDLVGKVESTAEISPGNLIQRDDLSFKPIDSVDSRLHLVGKVDSTGNWLPTESTSSTSENQLSSVDSRLNLVDKVDSTGNWLPTESTSSTSENSLGLVDSRLHLVGKVDSTGNWLPTESTSNTSENQLGLVDSRLNLVGKVDSTGNWLSAESSTAVSLIQLENQLGFEPITQLSAAGKVDNVPMEPRNLNEELIVQANTQLQFDLKEREINFETADKEIDYSEPESSKYLSDYDSGVDSVLTKQKSSFDSQSDESQKPNLIRSNTFELQVDDEHITLLRQNNERRQGSLLFQTSIQQFSTHLDTLPATPHNSIIQINDSVILDQDRPLNSLFYDKPDIETSETSDEPVPICQMKRDESIPIISGGVSSEDFKPEVRIESPSSRRKLESTPIISGGAVNPEPEIKIEKEKVKSAIATWVVDMKPVEQQPEIKEPEKLKQKHSLGFYVDLAQMPQKPQKNKPEEVEPDKKNIFSMVIDFEAPKKNMPSRLSQSMYLKKNDKPTTSKIDLMSQSALEPVELKPKLSTSQSALSLDSESGAKGESSDTVVKRRKSNNRTHNRHSWNSSESDTSTLCHQRTYSLSGEGTTELPKPVVETERKLDSSSSDENKDTSTDEAPKKMEIIAEVKEGGFVRLSDLDKPVPKIVTSVAEQKIMSRMTRSIPETSWIESKLMMTRSTGCRSSTSRLFPHLSTSTPNNIFMTQRSKSPGMDTDEMVSELSDLSSMHSSTALEVSTEETSHSSSYQPHHSADRLGHDLLRMFLEEISPDVTVEVGGRRLKAHKCILSSRCQYFAAMLSGGWVESAGNVISLQGFSYQAVHFAMCHIYSGAADIPDSISLVELATLADMLGLEGLKEVVAYTLKLKHCHLFHKPCSVCVVGVLECLPLAAAYGLDELYRKALRWITRYFVRVWPTRSFAMLPKELMEKCYQQHVVHMSGDNVLETTLCCDKLLVTLPTVRWAEVVHELTSQLADACQHYVTQHFSSVLASASFLTLGKELSWNISRLEEGLVRAADRLPPEQACRSYGRAHRLLALLESGEECWSSNFIDLVRKLLARVEDCVVRQAVRVSYTPAWPRLDSALRARIQDLCCLPLGLERPRVSRQPRSTSGSRNLDLRQVRLAMQQHSRRTQSTGPARPIKAPPPVRPVTDPPRPRTWPAQVTNKGKIISSSESSRTSSPAMKRTARMKIEAARPKIKENDMSLDSLASPVASKTRIAANKAKIEAKSEALIVAQKPKLRTAQPTKTKSTILKSNVQKNDKSTLSKSLPAMNKENRSKSGSSSSTQHSPSALLRGRQTNSSSSPASLPRTSMSPYNGSPSLRRSLLLAARSPQTPTKPVSPATNKRLARVAASHSVTSPTKSSAAKCVANQTNRPKTIPVRATAKTVTKKTDKPQVERSGTFLKDEPTVLNK